MRTHTSGSPTTFRFADARNLDVGNTPFWATLGFKLALNTASHPFEYAKVLIQIGHEPLAPYPTKTIFGTPALGLPNVLKYVQYIKRVDGFFGCYRGLLPRLMCNGINLTTQYAVKAETYKRTRQYFTYTNDETKKELIAASSDQEPEESELEKWEKLIHETLVELCGKVTAVIASQPFYVISVRAMAQFVGGEMKYDGILSSISEIYREEGILGFFRGLVPKLCAEIIFTLIIGACGYGATRILKEKDELKKISALSISLVGSTLTYPFHVVSTCIAVNNCGLMAGEPPHMPIYTSWFECWDHLSKNNQLNRGSGLFFRYYKGPYLSTVNHTLYMK